MHRTPSAREILGVAARNPAHATLGVRGATGCSQVAMLRLRHDCDHHLAAALLGRGEGGHPRHLRELWHLELGHLELGHLEPVAQGRYAHQILGGFEVVVEKKRGGAGARRVGPHMPHRQLEQVERERRAIRKAEGAFCHLAGGEMCSPGVHRRSS